MKESLHVLTNYVISILLLALLFCGFPLSVNAQENDTEDKTYSPRFYIPDSDTTLDALPLKSTGAEVSIVGVIADVTITQTYANEGTRAIEAKYVFPASTRAAIYYLHMRIGNRILIAQIKEKQEAQEIYDEAVEQGATATLLEQMTPNVFQMSVGNILPGDTIEIELKYTELLIPTDKVYEFVYPTVVGPRYTAGEGESWTEGPYQHENEDPLYDFDIEVRVNAGMPIGDIECPSDPELEIQLESPEVAVLIPGPEDKVLGNKDFILRYRLAGNEIQTGLLAYEGEEENFFLAMMQPPQFPGSGDIPPREYIFIMDVSGSMNGFPISVSKEMMRDMLYDLNIDDKFNILFFAASNYLFSSSSVYATTENIDAAIHAVDNQSGGGGTELMSALERALALQGTEEYSRIFLILTDGYVTVERDAFDLIRNNLGEANFFSFGIGSSVNRWLIEGIAHTGQGEPFIAINADQAHDVAEKFRIYVETPVLTNIDIDFNGFDAYDIEPLNIPDVFAERPVILYGKYNGILGGEILIDGLTGQKSYKESLNLNAYSAESANKALMYLWARKRIQLLDDYNNLSWEDDPEIIEEVTALGLKYSLITSYTSFVVVDSIIRCDTCNAETVNQPLPIPEGVTDNALGGFGSPTSSLGNSAESFYYDKNTQVEMTTFIKEVYPNPITNEFVVSVLISDLDIDLPKLINIYDNLGRLVSRIEISIESGGIHDIFLSINEDIGSLPRGQYFLQLQIGRRKSDRKAIFVL
jgi:Ca-activated chloride channel homolog